MALPKLNDVPKYTAIIPSTKKEVLYRPFLVKEQKVLLIALESQDDAIILQAIVDTIKSCLYDDINIDSLATFDVEYLFTQIRGKSVGETTELVMTCSDCKSKNEVTVPLNDIKIETDMERTFKLNDNYTLGMRFPSYKNLKTINEVKADTMTEALYSLIVQCLDTLMTEEEIINFDDEPAEEIESFLNSLNNEQFEKIVNFTTNLPKLSYDIQYNCISCKKENLYKLEGIADFF